MENGALPTNPFPFNSQGAERTSLVRAAFRRAPQPDHIGDATAMIPHYEATT